MKNRIIRVIKELIRAIVSSSLSRTTSGKSRYFGSSSRLSHGKAVLLELTLITENIKKIKELLAIKSFGIHPCSSVVKFFVILILSSCASLEKDPLAIRTNEYGSFEHKLVGLGSFSESCGILYEKKIVHGLFVLPINPLTKEEVPSLKNKIIRIKYLVRKMDFLYNLLGFVFSFITQTLVVEDCGRTYTREDIADQKSVEFLKSFLSKYGKIKSLRDEGKLNVKIVDGRMVVVLSSDILFPSGGNNLSAKGKQSIIEITKILSEIEDQKFQIEGHTDNNSFKVDAANNWDLAASRALSVLNTMIKSGMPASRISAASFGDSRPLVPNDSNYNKAKNRRIEIVVLPDIDSLPGYE